ncbi:MAG: divalent-cation tolerance protein CutA [Fibrobacteres bacterium]|nr:divalent-cation tolerance protein CutA [Fibrobacterota bacterium]
MPALLAYITAPDRTEALRIGKALLEARLAACINVIDGMLSMYWWQGKLEEAQECVLLVKTSDSRREELVAMVRDLHGYEVPCVVFWPLAGGNPEYLAWIEKECGGA